ncbi:MAG: UDP-glucuronic acid decarboxylase family protein [Myxococcota bacterium]
MRILVTGAMGFLGSHLCERLLGDGHDVIGLDNFLTGQRRNQSLLEGMAGFTLLERDVSTGPFDDLPALDRIYHLASPASPIDYIELPFQTMYANADGSRHLLQLAKAHGARFFLASTSEVYGDPAVHPQVESYWGNVNPIGPRSVYDEAKRYAEALSMAFARYESVEVRIVRIFNTYGPRMRHNDGRVIPTFITQALSQQPLTVFGDGTQTRSFCFATDLIDGFVRLMESDVTTPCNIGNPHELTMLELAQAINRVTHNPAGIVHQPLPKDDPTRRRPDITKANTSLGWEPKVDFEEGIERTIAWFQTVL